MTQTREIDGVLYEVTPFTHDKWELGGYDKIWNEYLGEVIEMQLFNSIQAYIGIIKDGNTPSHIHPSNLQLLKAVKEEYRYIDIYRDGSGIVNSSYIFYVGLEDCYNFKRKDVTFQGITKYTLVNGEVKSAEFIPKDKVEEMLKDSDNQ